MLQCPICEEWKGSYFKCYAGALGKLLGYAPAIADTAMEWLLLEEEPQYTQQYFHLISSNGSVDHYNSLIATQDLFLIYLCSGCAELTRKRLNIKDYELKPLTGQQCPCCGYYTIEDQYDICPVCFWEYDGWNLDGPCGPNPVTLRQGRANYRAFGACTERRLEFVRAPFPEEYPRYHQ